jgi:hypothetical protein
MKYSMLFILLVCTLVVEGQNTLGTLTNEEESLQGYTFFSPFSGTKAYMIDNCGYLVNTWDRGTKPGLSAYFLDNGLLFRTYKSGPVGPYTSASNAGGLELVDWNNNTIWSYEIDTPTELTHHDAVYLPNGNILVLSWELVYEAELIELGRDPNEIAPEGYMWSERILELEPVGTNEANIVWEWRIKDHYIQDFDPTKLNYGVVAEHPELFDINLPELNSSNSNSSRDWNHFNAIDYNSELDQILISVRNSDEIWILDHSTTTQEAASHEGGLYGKGGDILYRWGNASAYDRADVNDQKLFGQHGVNWIDDGLEDAGKIMIYNNGNGRPGTDYSTAEILTPVQDPDGGYPLPTTDPFGPTNSDIVYGDGGGEFFFSPYLSNAQRLPNGNTLINAGSNGSHFEITPDRTIVWEYLVPLYGDQAYSQGDTPSNNGTFRAYRFAPEFSGFEGIDLTPGSTIESGTDPESCTIHVTVTNTKEFEHSKVEVLYSMEEGIMELLNPDREQLDVILFDGTGRPFIHYTGNDHHQSIPVAGIPEGIYFLRIQQSNGRISSRKISIFR